jgi:hypothetical protein
VTASATDLTRLVNRLSVAHSNPLFDQTANRERARREPPRRRVRRCGGSPARAPLAKFAATDAITHARQCRRNRNHCGRNRRGAEGIESNRHDGLHSLPESDIPTVSIIVGGGWPGTTLPDAVGNDAIGRQFASARDLLDEDLAIDRHGERLVYADHATREFPI